MVIRGGFTLFATDAYTYLRERIMQPRVVVMWLCVLTGILLTTIPPVTQWPWLAITSAMFILTFRLWDDLADLTYDQANYPDRCLVRSTHQQAFRALLWLLLIGLTTLIFFVAGSGRALVFIAILVAFLCIYTLPAMRPDLRVIRTALVLIKYPAIIVLLTDMPSDRIVPIVAIGLYLLPLTDEVRSAGTGVLMPAAAFMGIAILAWVVLTT